MSIETQYADSVEGVDWQQVADIFSAVGWGDRSPEKVQASFQCSSFVRFAYRDNQLIGVGRTVDDGEFYGWIVDLAVLPEHQGKGIGARMLRDLEHDLSPFLTTMLTAAPGKSGFYEKQG